MPSSSIYHWYSNTTEEIWKYNNAQYIYQTDTIMACWWKFYINCSYVTVQLKLIMRADNRKPNCLNWLKAALSVVLTLANFLPNLQFAIRSLLCTPPHEYDNDHTKQETGGSCSLRVHTQTGLPLCGVLCPDWIKWAGIPKHFFTFLTNQRRQERHPLLPKHFEI